MDQASQHTGGQMGENAGHLSPPMCAGGHVSKDAQDFQMPSGESPSREEIARIKGTEWTGEDYTKYLSQHID